MSAGGRNAPLSPVSIGGSEWSFSSKVPPSADDVGPYSAVNSGRGNLASPPHSGGSNGAMSMNGFPSGPRSNGGPSPPPSIGRSSIGTNMYSSRSEGNRNSTRTDIDDSVLNEHYIALRAFLNARDPGSRQQPNKARDKLLRLSSVQFYELSTDVYDELMRRQATARAPPNAPNAPPAFLLPEKSFHPKRNQARQRLSSLGPPRFRDLAADVFHELERRFPQFVGGDPIPRVGSAMSMRGGPMRTGTPANGNMFPPRGQSRMRRPSDASSIRGPPPPDGYGMPPSPNMPNGEFGRPMPKQLNQNNTIVPNKSTMVEEDDENGEEGLDGLGMARKGGKRSEADEKAIGDYEIQVKDLRGKLDSLEDAMRKKDEEMNSILDGERSRATAANMEKKEWGDVRLNLENKLAEAQSLNKSIKDELERVRDDHDKEVRELRDELAEMHQGSRGGPTDPELQRENDELRESLRQQQAVTEEVRQEAQQFLTEMRTLSQQSSSTYEKQAEMEQTIERLENEVREWRSRYARAKTQVRSMRASSLGLTTEPGVAHFVRDRGFIEENGLIKDVHVTQFQIAIDELLQTARKEAPDKVTDAMKLVVVSVRRITKDLDESAPRGDDEQAQQHVKLKAKVSSTANGLITASKNFSAGAGLSPVSLLDAAASHLSNAIIDLLGTAKIRTTPAGELEEEDDRSLTPVDSTAFFSPRSPTEASAQDSLPPPPPFQGLGGVRASAESSAYSPISSPRESIDPYPGSGVNGLANGGGYMGYDKSQATSSGGYGLQRRDSRAADLKVASYGTYTYGS
ncbi:component of the polarisome [Purpureocillium takamizusanense]|uniref:Component of the polarisome n=1 Tax=Purpureocillium takamizusanense TaxID=2060973 RepID=A0A9Q8VE76_9HYPO|nr:component of the polarisome [Purpureocillium takamizusanense]UNI23585.1 component of the polarisome [Purpureocillium takamizusanense]